MDAAIDVRHDCGISTSLYFAIYLIIQQLRGFGVHAYRLLVSGY